MRMLIFCLLVVLLEINTGCSGGDSATMNSQNSQNDAAQSRASPAETAETITFDDPRLAATNALADLRHLLTEGQNFRDMGFDNLEQLDQARLGEPASVYTVGLDDLREYGPGSDPQALLIDTKRMVFPVVVDGSGRTLITVEHNEGKWHAVSFGDQRVARNLVRVREDKSSGEGQPTSDYFLVQVNALFLTFLGKQQPSVVGANSLRLVPLHEKDELEVSLAFRENRAFLRRNRTFNAEDEGSMRAKDVFGALSTSAKKIDSSKPF
jgi:hypothetical protein